MSRNNTDVIVIGAGISGLVTAYRLHRMGVERVIVIEARSRVGGRTRRFVTPGNRTVEGGGEFLGDSYRRLYALADELGLERTRVPAYENPGVHVRFHDGSRILEPDFLASDPRAASEYEAVVAALDTLGERVDEVDAQTLAVWLATQTDSVAAREALLAEFEFAGGDPAEISLGYLAHTLHRFGGFEPWAQAMEVRLTVGTSGLVDALAAASPARIVLGDPVTQIASDAHGVEVTTQAGDIYTAGAVVFAASPAIAQRVRFVPELPPKRALVQEQWKAAHGQKVFAFFSGPWWRDEGFSGLVAGHPLFSLIMDVTSDVEGVLVGFTVESARKSESARSLMRDSDALGAALIDAIAEAFGERVRSELREVAVSSWLDDEWSAGCSSGLPTGVLSVVGDALSAPIGRLVWAGTEAGFAHNDYLEGAVAAGENAALTAVQLLENHSFAEVRRSNG